MIVPKSTQRLAKVLLLSMLVVLGVVLVTSAFLFLFKTYGLNGDAVTVDAGVTTLLIVGLATLVLVHVLPGLQSLKFGTDGIDVQFRDLGLKVTNDQSVLEGRIAALEARLDALQPPAPKAARRAAVADKPASGPTQPPREMLKAGVYYDDPRKGRFGRKATRDGFTLSASFQGPRDKSWTDVVLSVETDPGVDAADVDVVEFYLHNTFHPDDRKVRFADGEANLALTIWGGFTVGAWIPARGICLELDLAKLDNAPPIVREH
jgi:hypothetical protein